MAVVEVKMPAVFQKVLGCPKSVQSKGDTVGQVLKEMEKNYPGLKGYFINAQGRLSMYVII